MVIPKLVLASQSPRRREILERAGFAFEVRVAGVPEELQAGESPTQYVRRLSRAKAGAVVRSPEEIVIGADTIVVLDGQVLEKPEDAAHAHRMLRMLSGRVHSVLTGICILHGDQVASDHAMTTVRFSEMSEAEIDDIIASGESIDKAGSYAIQGIASRFVEHIEGCYLNVVGLPVSLVYRRLKGILSPPRPQA